MNELIEMLQNAAVEIKRLNSEIEHVRLMKACLEDHVLSVEYHNDELRIENDKLKAIIENARQAINEVQLIDNTPREAAYVRLELLYSLQ